MRVAAFVFVKMDFKYSYDNVSGLHTHPYYNESVGGKDNFSVTRTSVVNAAFLTQGQFLFIYYLYQNKKRTTRINVTFESRCHVATYSGK